MNAPTNLNSVVGTVNPLVPNHVPVQFTWQDNSDNEDGFYLQRKQVYKKQVGWAGINFVAANETTLFANQFIGNSGRSSETYRIAAFRGPTFGPWEEVAYSDEIEVQTP